MALAYVFILISNIFNILYFIDGVHVAVLEGELKTVTDVEKFFSKLRYGKLLTIIDLLTIPLNGIIVFSQLIDQLLSEIFKFLFHFFNSGFVTINGGILILNQLLDLLNIFTTQL